jgi:hypothetical protein
VCYVAFFAMHSLGAIGGGAIMDQMGAKFLFTVTIVTSAASLYPAYAGWLGDEPIAEVCVFVCGWV